MQHTILHMAAADAELVAIIGTAGGCPIKCGGKPFQSLVEAIIYQQLAGRAANAISARFMKLYTGRFPAPARLLSTPDETLRTAGLSGRKIEYMKDLAARVSESRLDLAGLAAMDDEQVVEQLSEVKGICRWTAEMFLIFCLGRPDVLPVGDYGLRRAMQKTYRLRDLPLPEHMEKIAKPWRPYRSVATWYMWKSLEKFKVIG